MKVHDTVRSLTNTVFSVRIPLVCLGALGIHIGRCISDQKLQLASLLAIINFAIYLHFLANSKYLPGLEK